MAMRILAVDDHPMVRKGVRSFLEGQDGFELCGEAVNGLEAVAKAQELKPDLILMDISMPGMDGLDATREILRQRPQTRVVILSQHDAPEMMRQALNAGARAYVNKSAIARDLLGVLSQIGLRQESPPPVVLGSQGKDIDAKELLQRSSAFETALKQTEHRLRRLVEYQSAVMNNMAEGLYTLDANGLVTSINPAGEAILGWTRDELLGRKMHDVTHYQHPDGTPYPASECPGLHVLQEGIALREHEDVFIRKDGSLVPVVFSASPLREDDKITGVIVGFRDDTEQRQAKEALLQAKRELGNVKDRLQFVTDTMAAAVAWCNRDFRYLWANQSLSDLLQVPLAEIVGRPISEVLGEEAFQILLPHFQAVLAGRKVSYEEELVYRGLDRKWISATYTPTFDASGVPDGWVAVVWDITDRKREEEMLRQGADRFRALVRATSYFTCRLNPDWTEIKQLDERGLVSETSDLKPNWLEEYIHPADQRLVFEKVQEAIRSKAMFELEHRVRRPDGTVGWTLSRAVPILNEQGAVVEWFGTAADVTRHKQAEQSVRDASEQRRRFLDTAATGLMRCSRDLRYLEVNPAYAEIVGVPADRIVGRTLPEMLGAEMWEKVRPNIERVLRGERVEYEAMVRYPTGRSCHVHVVYAPERDEAGQIAGWVASITDITELKHAEEKLRERTAELETLLDSVPAFVWIAQDPECKVIAGNKAAAQLEDAPVESGPVPEDARQTGRWFDPQGQELERSELPMQRAAAAGRAIEDVELKLITPGNRTLWVRGNSVPLFTEDGHVRGVVSCFSDITQSKATEDRLRESREQLERQVEERTAALTEANRQLRALTATLLQAQDRERRKLARELHDSAGQMLNALAMNLYRLRKSGELSSENVRVLADADRLLHDAAREIRTFSHLLHPPLLDEAGLLKALESYVHGFQSRSGIATGLEILGEQPGRLPADLELATFRIVQEALTNIHRHSGSATARVRLTRSDGALQLEITDQGKGIPPDRQSGLATGGSTGVGLRGMRERIAQLGGSMEIRTGDSGTTVSATLPVAVALPPAAATATGKSVIPET